MAHVNVKLTYLLTKPVPVTWLAAIIIVGHIHAVFAYGATFWVDSDAYIFLAQMFESKQSAQAIMDDPKLWTYTSHIALGEPLIWFMLSKLPVNFIWPAMVVVQHGCGALAQIYLFTTLNKIKSSCLLVVPCLLMAFFPFHQAMHNSLMTEAMSGACFIVAISAGLRLAYFPRKRDYVFLGISGLGAFFRIYFVVIPFVSLFVLFFFRKISLSKAMAVGLVCSLGFLLTPLFMYMAVGHIGVPSLGINKMWQTSAFAPTTPRKAIEYTDSLPWPSEQIKQNLLQGNFSRFDTIDTGVYWHRLGMTRQEANALSTKLDKLFNDQPGIWKRRIIAALVCMGVPAAVFLPADWQHRREHLAENRYLALTNSYTFFSWVNPSREQYETLSGWPYFSNGPEHLLMKEAWQPYLNFSTSERLRDIFGLAKLPIDIWPILGLLSLIIMLRRNWFCASLVGLNCLALFASFYLANIPGIRYTYAPILLYFTAIGLATLPGLTSKRD